MQPNASLMKKTTSKPKPKKKVARTRGQIANGNSPTPTKFQVRCPLHGSVFLTPKEFLRQMANSTESRWRCPFVACRLRSDWEGAAPETPEGKETREEQNMKHTARRQAAGAPPAPAAAGDEEDDDLIADDPEDDLEDDEDDVDEDEDDEEGDGIE